MWRDIGAGMSSRIYISHIPVLEFCWPSGISFSIVMSITVAFFVSDHFKMRTVCLFNRSRQLLLKTLMDISNPDCRPSNIWAFFASSEISGVLILSV